MKSNGPLTTYNRAIVRAMVPRRQLAASLLGLHAAEEAKMIVALVHWADADRTTYEDHSIR